MNDLRIAWRMLRRSPGYALIAVLTLGLAIGGATTIFSVLNTVVLRPLPYADPERLVLVRDAWPPRFPEFSVSPGRFLEWQQRTRAFDSLAASQNATFNLTGSGEPMRLRGARVSWNMFGLLGVPALKGRTFTAEEDKPGSDAELIISEGLWRDRFGADADIVGRKLIIDEAPVTVVGVMPASFVYPNAQVQAWAPIAFSDSQRKQYGSHYIAVMARLKRGVTIEAARADQLRAAKEIEAVDRGNEGWTSIVFPYLEYQVRGVQSGLWVLSAAVAAVLLIACANIANLLLARGLGRQREMGLRAALGATRLRLVRQMLVENGVIAVAGSVLGVAIAWASLVALAASPSVNLPRAYAIGLDIPTLVCAALLAAGTPFLFGLLPAIQLSRTDLRELMAAGGRSGASALRAHTRGALIVAEVALAVMLVVGSSLLMQSFSRLMDVSPGFDTTRELVVSVSLPSARYDSDDKRETFWRTAVETIARQPGIESAAAVQALPFFGDHVSGLAVPGKTPDDPNQQPSANFYAITPDYLKTMGIPLVKGRTFSSSDSSKSGRVALVSESVVARIFGGANPLGQHVIVSQGPTRVPAEIVGVVGDIKQYGLDSATTLQVYQPAAQHPYFGSMLVVVRAAGSPDAVTSSLRKTLAGLDPLLPILTARSMASALDASVGTRRLTAMLLDIFAGMALLLSIIGTYGLVAFTVRQRTQEIGVRLALGSPRSRVLGLMFRHGLLLGVAGAVLGTIGAIWAAKLLETELFNATSHDTIVAFAIAPLTLIAAVALASYLPALRALRVDPVTALRQ